MRPFLYIDNWDRPQPKNRLEQLLDDLRWKVHRVRGQDSLPEHVRFCGAFVGPSDAAAYDARDWILSEQDYLCRLASAGVPILGLCFGSQILACSLLGPEAVFARGVRECGAGVVKLTSAGQADELTRDLPCELEVFHWHGDEVVAAHRDMTVLATSELCKNQMWRWRLGPVWGVQPHPEYDTDGMRLWLEADQARFTAAGFDAGAAGRAAPHCSEAGRVFTRFAEIVVEHDVQRRGVSG